MPLAFDLADKYRNPAMLLLDGTIGQMIEPCEIKEIKPLQVPKPWAVTGAKGRSKNIHNTLWMDPLAMEELSMKMQAKYRKAAEEDVRFHEYKVDDAELVIVAYGSPARISKSVVDMAREEGLKVGLFRPISLFPYPTRRIQELAAQGKRFLVVEMSVGQMVEDVRLAVNGTAQVDFYGRCAGVIPTPEEIFEYAKTLLGSKGSCSVRREEVSR
jgi:2-oxoglutarate ferredoxin oxidoreductase subunit alpha